MNYNLLYAYIIISSLLCTQAISAKEDTAEPALNSPILTLIDGISGLMDEHIVHKTILLGRELSKLQLGNVDPATKKRMPQYAYNGQLYTLRELAMLEQQREAQDSNLADILARIKADFEVVTTPFMHEARGTRQHMIHLIEEWCQKRQRPDSLLLNWSEGTENESFRRDVNSLQKMDIFCTDLTNFLKDLVRSCPKARKRFIDWEKQHKK